FCRFTINMQHGSVGFYLLVLLLFHPLSLTDLEEVDEVPVEVVTNSSPCSTTCGLGVKTQTLCFLQDGKTAMEETKGGTTVRQRHLRHLTQRNCLESWQCGLRTMTVTSGQKVEIDCLGEINGVICLFVRRRVSWRYARGVISSDDSLFARWEAPQLDRVILNPVREEDAGTYRCDVQDAAFRRVKRIYWGIRVLPVGILNLDYESSEAQWESTGNHQSRTVPQQSPLLLLMAHFCIIKPTMTEHLCLWLITLFICRILGGAKANKRLRGNNRNTITPICLQ
uniref:Transmembrane protein 81 n=1 Tax=Stegastes partitus TaxID=144197 RepID=A0A3B4Z1V1_9TELE